MKADQLDLNSSEKCIAATRCWIEKFVIAKNLCPFAKKPSERGQVHYALSVADNTDDLLNDFLDEIESLVKIDPLQRDTTVLIHPYVLGDFVQYIEFINGLEFILEGAGYIDTFQIASLHPDYQFEDVAQSDVQNYTNRSPYPIIHLLRQESVSKALASYVQPERIPERNIRLMQKYGVEKIQTILEECKQTSGQKA